MKHREKVIVLVSLTFIGVTTAIVVTELINKPMTAHQVASRVEGCFFRGDAGCILLYIDPLEKQHLQLTKEKVQVILDMQKPLRRAWRRSGDAVWDEASDSLTLSQTYVKGDGQSARMGFTIGKTRDGYRFVSAASTLVLSPIMSFRLPNGTHGITGVEKVKLILAASKIAQAELEHTGLRGVYSRERSSEPVRTWSVMQKNCEEIIARSAPVAGT